MKTLKATSFAVLAALATLHAQGQDQARQPDGQQEERFRFRSNVELVNVTATVSDQTGRFVSGLTREDFLVYEDEALQEITHFSSERVPVSLGIVLDTSGSMEGDKIRAARSAIERLLGELSDPEDEFFLYRFSNDAHLQQGWTSDRRAMSAALGRMNTVGDTAMYDAVAEAVPFAAKGRNQKKAVIVISDGNDTSSLTRTYELRQLIRESEVLVYAIGIDGEGGSRPSSQPPVPPRPPIPFPPYPPPRPYPPPPPRRPLMPGVMPAAQWPFPGGSNSRNSGMNEVALRDMTDDSGGRTEIVRGSRDLQPATASIAAELTKQYYIGYPPKSAKDGRWHSIRVEVRKGGYRVRARRGYIAS